MNHQSAYRFANVLLFCALACAAIYFIVPQTSSPRKRKSSSFAIESNHTPFKFADPDDSRDLEFPIFWPPNAAERAKNPTPLLAGELSASVGTLSGKHVLNVRATLSRPQSEERRVYWNKTLAFPEYDWMSRVRVWDQEKQWLWPNLPFLLRAHGAKRQQRYGGVDPGKNVDNDFAAIVVQPLGNERSPDQRELSAQWHGPPMGTVDKHSVVHQAISEDLQLDISGQHERFGVWIIYADFLDSPPPRSWPEESEFDGGILAYFTIEIGVTENGRYSILDIAQATPLQSTGVDWEKWRGEN